MNEIKKVLAEDGSGLLVRVDGQVELGANVYKTWHHEIWTDRDKFEADITEERLEDGQHIYCCNLAGFTDEDALQSFERRESLMAHN
ncbi:hypothetical protein EJP82_01375 [Paenibacillus anaericanus]|uniref:Uncharacterized protein n=1 Tax=Paenibacillus anaericanus TaxID=170367 RepID=A0A433YFG9_9BACL|nr:hypothetical protein [Paenibacillus anaericanus]RUT48620.1 hypothetical protein EJP82_01375 [Paenibacillus anaericanus]